MFCFLFLAPYARTIRYEEAFFSLFPWKTKEKKARFARAPHYYVEFSIAQSWSHTETYWN